MIIGLWNTIWRPIAFGLGVFLIAWRSVRYRGLGSFLTVLSMALGVTMVVSVLSIYGLVSNSFRTNSSFGYDLLVGARGGGTQLTMSSVFYLSKPIETIPYEYYLAFRDANARQAYFENSIAVRGLNQQRATSELIRQAEPLPGLGGWNQVASEIAAGVELSRQREFMKIDRRGLFANYVDFAVPILLGDTYQVEGSDKYFKVCATNEDFFKYLELDINTHKKFSFSEGRAFSDNDSEVGFFGCVVGALAAKQAGLRVGDQIKVTHGVPGSGSSHLHDQLFTIVGIMNPTGTPNDRVLLVNMEGFYLINDHVKPVSEASGINLNDADDSAARNSETTDEGPDPFFESELNELSGKTNPTGDAFPDIGDHSQAGSNSSHSPKTNQKRAVVTQPSTDPNRDWESGPPLPLPVEQRELTALLIRSYDPQGFGAAGGNLKQPIEQKGGLDSTLSWSSFRPALSQASVQCVSPIQEVFGLFKMFVEPTKWILLALTTLICLVSGLSIMVGIYNSMNQRHHEIAVMRALGARRSHVMMIMLTESILLSVGGGILGWVCGHLLNIAISPIVENQTGIPVRFWDIAPPEPIFAGLSSWLGSSHFGAMIVQFRMSPELLLIPGLIFLAVLVGVYPAVSAYRTDVAKSLGK